MNRKIIKSLLAPICILAISHGNLFAQPTIQWSKVYQGRGIAAGYSVISTSDLGYAMVGVDRHSPSPRDTQHIRVVKVDANGNVEWTKTYGGSNGEGTPSIVQSPDGGFTVAATTSSTDGDISYNHGGNDIWVFKLSSKGVIEWERSYGGSGDDEGRTIARTNFGGYVIAGRTTSSDGDVAGNTVFGPMWVIEIDSLGKLLWQRCYGGKSYTNANSIIATADGGFAVAGLACSTNGTTGYHRGSRGDEQDAWVLKLDSLGFMQWDHCYGGSNSDEGYSNIQTADGSYAVSGITGSSDGDAVGLHSANAFDAWMIRLDPLGKIKWQKCLGGTDYDYGGEVVQTVDRGFLLAASTRSRDGDVTGIHPGLDSFGNQSSDFWLVKLDSTGTIEWNKCLGGSKDEYPASVVSGYDGSITLFGTTSSRDGDVFGLPSSDSSDFWLVKLQAAPCNDIRVSMPGGKLQAHAGDTVRIPIVALDSSVRPLSILDFSLRLNTDLLTPIRINPSSGLLAGVKPSKFIVEKDSLSLELKLPNATRIGPGTLCVLECIAMVTTTTTTTVTLQRVGFADPPFNSSCLTAVTANGLDSSIAFRLVEGCGDPSISSSMTNTLGLEVGAISPNPVSQSFSVLLRDRAKGEVKLDVLDVLGRIVLHHVQNATGADEVIRLEASGLTEGSYVLRVSDGQSATTSRKLIVRRN